MQALSECFNLYNLYYSIPTKLVALKFGQFTQICIKFAQDTSNDLTRMSGRTKLTSPLIIHSFWLKQTPSSSSWGDLIIFLGISPPMEQICRQ